MYGEYKIVIPARLKSSRFPEKPLAKIAGKSLIKRVYDQCAKALKPQDIYVATDSEKIEKHCLDQGMQVVMTSDKCRTGTDRCFEAERQINGLSDRYYIINVQGDEPLIDPRDITTVIEAHKKNPRMVYCGMCPISDEEEFRSVGVPKVVVDEQDNLLYMSRAAVPTTKKLEFVKDMAMKQVCIYAFPMGALYQFYSFGRKSKNEYLEDIEILRFIEMHYKINMVRVSGSSIAVDFPEDVARVEEALKLRGEP